jgi:DNA cross-link repair 1A protein
VIKLAQGKEGEVDVKPDLAMQESEMEARGKQMMQGWLVKKQEEGVKEEEGRETGGAGSEGGPGGTEREKEVKKKGRTLVVMGTYSIGKERIVKGESSRGGMRRVWAVLKSNSCGQGDRVKDILRSAQAWHPDVSDRQRAARPAQRQSCRGEWDSGTFDSPSLSWKTRGSICTGTGSSPVQCQVHLLPLGSIQLDRLQPYLHRLHPHFDRILGFRPTGWTYTPPAGTDLLPDVNTVIKRDQARWFSESSLKPMRGSCREYMMYGEYGVDEGGQEGGGGERVSGCRASVARRERSGMYAEPTLSLTFQACRTLSTRASLSSRALHCRFPAQNSR